MLEPLHQTVKLLSVPIAIRTNDLLYSPLGLKPASWTGVTLYKFACTETRCNSTYYGFTTNSLKKSASQHVYKGSSVYKHYFVDHDILPPKLDGFVEQVLIFFFPAANLLYYR